MTTTATNLATVERLYDAFARQDLATVLAAVHPDIAYVNDVPLPWGGTYHGPAGMAEFFGKLFGALDVRIVSEELVVSGDKVMQIGRSQGTVRANGAEFDAREVHIWSFEDGLVTRFEVLLDVPLMQAALS